MEAPARRVQSFDDLSQAGDYFGPTDEVNAEGEKVGRGVWFLLPLHEGSSVFERPTEGSGLHRVSEPPWTFRECDDGSLEIRASILCGRTDERPEGYFHGFLNEGNVWTWS
jgi:hypothetical protein